MIACNNCKNWYHNMNCHYPKVCKVEDGYVSMDTPAETTLTAIKRKNKQKGRKANKEGMKYLCAAC